MRVLYHILYPDGMGDDRFIYEGYKYAFEKNGHQTFPFTEKQKLSERLKEVRPDIFITSLHVLNVDRDIQAVVDFRKNGGKVFFQAGQVVPEKELTLAKKGTLADFYYTQNPNDDFERMTGHPIHLLPLAALPQYHFPTAPVEKYLCDIAFVGANLPRKREMFARRLLPLFKKYNVKVFGGDWDWFDRYALHPLSKIDRKLNLGGVFSRWRINRQVPLEEENEVYSSAKICLNFHENNDPQGVNGRTFRVPASGGFLFSDYVEEINNYFVNGKEIVMAKTDDEWFSKIGYYMTHDNERIAIQKAGTARALREHTYLNRAATMLGWLSAQK